MKEVNKAKALSRDLAGLMPDINGQSAHLSASKVELIPLPDFTKASPLDISSFHRDTTVKYPTFEPEPTASIPISPEKLSDGIKPLPQRTNYHSTEIPPAPPSSTLRDPFSSTAAPHHAPLPGTPAPTPPPSPAPKTKKQQYQTDPTKPFVFPYTRNSAIGATSLVPFAIQEADRLYAKHSYVSLGLFQLWQEREECLREERGLGMSGLIGFDRLALDDDEDGDEAALEAMLRESRYEEEEMMATEAGDKQGAKAARQKLASSKRLHRVDIIYVSPTFFVTTFI